jgi:hypothetical protein
MISARSFAPAAILAATFAATTLTPALAHADVHSTVEDIASKGKVPPIVPVEGGLGLGLAAAILALGVSRSRR